MPITEEVHIEAVGRETNDDCLLERRWCDTDRFSTQGEKIYNLCSISRNFDEACSCYLLQETGLTKHNLVSR